MKLPKYPLQAVMDLRDKEKDEAEKLLAQRLRELAEAREMLSRLREELAEIRKRALEKQASLYDLPDDGNLDVREIEKRRLELRFLEQRIKRKKEEMEAQESEVERALQAVGDARTELTSRVQALKAIEKHQGKWKSAVLAAEKKKEEKLIEEVAASAFLARQRESEQ